MLINYIKDLWNGNIKLYIVVWIYFILVGEIFHLLFIEKLHNTNIYSLILIFYPYKFFIYKSIWSSANNYAGKLIWKIFSKIIVATDLLWLVVLLPLRLFGIVF